MVSYPAETTHGSEHSFKKIQNNNQKNQSQSRHLSGCVTNHNNNNILEYLQEMTFV